MNHVLVRSGSVFRQLIQCFLKAGFAGCKPCKASLFLSTNKVTTKQEQILFLFVASSNL